MHLTERSTGGRVLSTRDSGGMALESFLNICYIVRNVFPGFILCTVAFVYGGLRSAGPAGGGFARK